ncbi:MAG: gephyrin-like molybdotransferase Glp [Paracoccaceae bacterium]
MTTLQKIETQSCGCDAHVHNQGLINLNTAFDLIAAKTVPIEETEDIPLVAAPGRVLKSSVRCGGMVPPFDNSAMDGYAINTGGFEGAGPWQLDVTDRIAAGQSSASDVTKTTAVQIFTGAMIPAGADAVVMQEDVQRTGGTIVIRRKVKPGTHVRRAGEDMQRGQMIVPMGRRLTARDIAVCAAAGKATVQVCRNIKVALLVTGDEVKQAGSTLGPAGIWDVNTPTICAAMLEHPVTLTGVHVAGDTRQLLTSQIAALARKNDLIVTTGGISVGEEDHVQPAMTDLGAEIAFGGVALKPGKPVSFGKLGQTHWLGLPGNPLSAFVTWQLFGTTICKALTGQSENKAQRRHVVLANELHHKPGRCELRLAQLSGFDGEGREIVQFNSSTHSGRVARLPNMDGMLFIPAETEGLPSGALVEFQPF